MMSYATQHFESTHTLLDVDEVLPAAPDSCPLLDSESESYDNLTPKSNEVHGRTGENQAVVWLLLATPLILHFLSAIILTVAITYYINGNSFNLDSRRVLATFAPLQSDITTAISSGVSILRIFTTMWITSTAWRCAFILMEKEGISLEQLGRLLTWRIYFNSRPISSRKFQAGALISVILLAAFPCQLSGPIITGSITWTPSHGFIGGKPIDIATRFTIPDWSKYNFSNPRYHLRPKPPFVTFRAETVTAAYVSFIAWPRQGSPQDDDGRTMKRVTSRVAYLPVHSSLSNVTLPYFAVTKLEWITNRLTENPEEKLIQSVVTSTSLYNPFYNGIWQSDSKNRTYGKLVYTFAMIPDNWDKPTPPPTPFTGTVTETRILAGVYSQSSQGPPCSARSPFGNIPHGIGLANLTVNGLPGCFIFARVTYTAGASECADCRTSSWITVQNDSSLTVLPDLTTVDALDLMPFVALQMAAQNVSIPTAYNNLDGYVTGLLTRSYGAAWTYLTDNFVEGQRMGVTTNVQIAVPTSKANVSWPRVLIWLALNILFTLSGLIFLLLQKRCSQRVVLDTSIAALLLDTSDVLHKNNRAFCNFSRLVKDDEDIGYLELRQDYGGHRHVVVVEK